MVTSFRRAFRRHGIPAGVLTDNAAIFTGKPRGGGRVCLELELDALGVKLDHSRPRHPQTCGKVERFHQTQKKWLAAQPPAVTLVDLQRQLDRFRRYYNTVRPHRAIGRRTPAQAYAARPKARPAGPRLNPHYRVRRDRTDGLGVVTLRYHSQLRHIALGREHARRRVFLLIADLHVRVIDAETANSCASSSSIPPRTTNPWAGRQVRPRSPECNDVPTHLSTVSRDIADGAPPGIRTPNPVIKSHLLCH